ncbi:hypothetical protein [Leuconostoc falkenbergense]|uniref:hypothetical protein n=1 Tax=Leuconostoc falkenbergense TaxID=2766470 RepID=UPI0021A9B7C8|nr:hypothetical protein [Leuconostoc falkenbergense]MCT4390402.1 hypothetical protein [Leuconostoc falkenbergense]
MFKYYITAWVEDKTGYYLTSEQVTSVTVYAKTAHEAEEKTTIALPAKKKYGSNYVWVLRIDKMEGILDENND